MQLVIDGIIFSCNKEISLDEAKEYIKRGRDKYGYSLTEVNAHIDEDFVDLSYKTSVVPFERVRRITGYLVGTLDRFNDAKRAEEADRVKHGIEPDPAKRGVEAYKRLYSKERLNEI